MQEIYLPITKAYHKCEFQQINKESRLINAKLTLEALSNTKIDAEWRNQEFILSDSYLHEAETTSRIDFQKFRKNSKIEVYTKTEHNPWGWYQAIVASVTQTYIQVKQNNQYDTSCINVDNVRKSQANFSLDDSKLQFFTVLSIKFPYQMNEQLNSNNFKEQIKEFKKNQKILKQNLIENSSILLMGSHENISKTKESIVSKINTFSMEQANYLINSVENLIKKIENYRADHLSRFSEVDDFYNNYPDLPQQKIPNSDTKVNFSCIPDFKDMYLLKIFIHDLDCILTVGEEDFSYPFCLIKIMSQSTQLITTSYKDAIQLRSQYNDKFNNQTRKIQLMGGEILHEVDCTKLKNQKSLDRKIDMVIFNQPLPHIPDKIDEFDYKSENVKMFLESFFISVQKILAKNGYIMMTFPKKDQKAFDVTNIALRNGYVKVLEFDFIQEVLKYIQQDYKPQIPSAYEHNGSFEVKSSGQIFCRSKEINSEFLYNKLSHIKEYQNSIIKKIEFSDFSNPNEFKSNTITKMKFITLVCNQDYGQIAVRSLPSLIQKVINSSSNFSNVLQHLLSFLNQNEALQLRELNKEIYDEFNNIINIQMKKQNLQDHTKQIKYFTLAMAINQKYYQFSEDYRKEIFDQSLNYLNNINQSYEYIIDKARYEFLNNLRAPFKLQSHFRQILEENCIKVKQIIEELINNSKKKGKNLKQNKIEHKVQNRTIQVFFHHNKYYAMHLVDNRKIYLESTREGQSNGFQYYQYPTNSRVAQKYQLSFCKRPIINPLYLIDRWGISMVKQEGGNIDFKFEISLKWTRNQEDQLQKSRQVDSTAGSTLMFPIWVCQVQRTGIHHEKKWSLQINSDEDLELIEEYVAVKKDQGKDPNFDFIICKEE